MRDAQMIPLGVAAPFTTGATPPTKDNRYFGDGYLWANISDLGPKYLERTAKSVTQAGYEAAPFGPIAEPGDLLFSFKLSVGTVSIAAEKMLTNEAIATFRPGSLLDMGYAYYILPIYLLRAAGHNIYGAPMLNDSIMRRTRVPVPDLDIQRAIADYLDRETGEIDAMIAKMDELAETLEARRETVVLDSIRHQDNVTLQSLRLAASLITGSTPAGGQDANFSDTGTMGWVTPEDLTSPVRASRFLSPAGLGQLRTIPGGSALVCCIGATVGKLGYADQPITTNQQITAVVPRQRISGRYLYYALAAERSQILSEAVTTTLPIINNARLGGLAVSIPSLSAQRRIADHLDEVTGKIDAMLAKVAELRSLLIERRAALITDVVTGRKAVA